MRVEDARILKTADGAVIAYRRWRPAASTGPRRTVVALHGLASNMTRWAEFAAATGLLELGASMEQVRVDHGCEMSEKSLRELQLRREIGVIVLGIRRVNGAMEFNPTADAVIHAGDHLIVMGEPHALRRLESMLIGAGA